MRVRLALLCGVVLVACPVVVVPSKTSLGTVIVIGNERYDFNADTSTPDKTEASAVFVQLGSVQTPAADPFAALREKCFDTSSASGLVGALKLPLPSGTPLEAGASIGLSGTAAFGTLNRSNVGLYAASSNLPQSLPTTLNVSVPGAAGGFPAIGDAVTLSSAALRLQGFKVNEPPIGTQGDLLGDVRRGWTPGKPAAAGSSSVVLMEFFGVQKRSDHVTCLANDDGEFFLRESDPAYVMLKQNNSSVRFESSARAVAHIKQVGEAYLTTVVVDRTLALPPAP